MNEKLTAAVRAYFADLRRIRASGGATDERSTYGPLANLLNAVGATLNPKVSASASLPNQGAGHRDFGLYTAKQVQRGKPSDGQVPERGVVEVKAPRGHPSGYRPRRPLRGQSGHALRPLHPSPNAVLRLFSAWVLWARQEPVPKKPFDWGKAVRHLRVPVLRTLFWQLSDPGRLEPLGLAEVLHWTGAAVDWGDRTAFFSRFSRM